MSGSAYDSVPPAVRAQWAQLNNFDNPPRHVRMIIPVTIVLGISVILIVGARFWVRVFVQRKVDIADWLIFIVTAYTDVAVPLHAIQDYGYDRHIYDLHTPTLIGALKFFFVGYFTYFILSGLVRMSILFFYLRLTDRATNRGFICAVWVLIAFTIVYMLSFSISIIFTCNPTSGFWMRIDPDWSKETTHHCFNEGAHIMSASAVSALDLAVAILPTVLFWNLRLPRRQKIALWALFSIGTSTAVVSLIRFYYIYLDFYKSYDFTWWGYYLWVWTDVELCVAINCASAPALKSIFIRYFESGTGSGRHREPADIHLPLSNDNNNTEASSGREKSTRRRSMYDLEMLVTKEDSWDSCGLAEDQHNRPVGSMIVTTELGSDSGSSGSSGGEHGEDSSRSDRGSRDMVVRVKTTLTVLEAERSSSKDS